MAIKIRTGYELTYSCPQPTPMILTLSVHPSRRRDLLTPDKMQVQPLVAATPNAQRASTAIGTLPPGTYVFTAELRNAAGATAAKPLTVTIRG